MDEVPPEYLSDEEACALIGAPKPQKPGNENGAKNRSPASPRGASARLIVFGRAGLAAQLGREPLSLFGRDTSTPEVLDGFPKTGAQAEFLRRLNCLRTCTGYPTSAGRLTCGHLASFRRTAVFDGLGDAASVASVLAPGSRLQMQWWKHECLRGARLLASSKPKQKHHSSALKSPQRPKA